jgi:O-antigen ligase
VVTSVEWQASAPAAWSRTTRVGTIGASEYRPLLVALPVAAAIVAGMAVGSAPLTLGASLAAFGAAVVSPPVGLAIAALMTPLKSPLAVPAPGFNMLLVGAILLGCVYRLPVDRPTLRPRAPLLLLLAFVVYVSAQQLPEMLAGYPGIEGHAVGYLFFQELTLAGLAVAASCVLRGRSPWPYIGAGLVSAFVAAILAIATFSQPATGALGNLVGLSNAAARVTGPFGDPNYYGLFQATAIAAAVAWMVVARSRPVRLLLLGGTLVLGLSLAVTLSRSALLALAAGLLALAFTRSRRAGFFAVGALVVLATVVYPLFLQWRVLADSGGLSAQAYATLAQSDQSRVAAALAGPRLFASAPLFGIGFGQYPLMSGRYVGFAIESHNWYANVLAEQGIVGIALWVLMLAAVAFALHRVSWPARSVGYAVLVTYMVGSAFLQPPNSVQTSAFALIVIVAALVGDWGSTAGGRVPARSSTSKPGR